MPRAHRRGPRGRGALRAAAPRARSAAAGRGRPGGREHRRRDSLGRCLSLLYRPRHSRCAGGAEPRLARRAVGDGRRRERQQRGRHHQLRDARVRAAAACLRSGQDPWWPHRRAAGRGRGAVYGDQPQDLHAHRTDVRDRRCRRPRGPRRGDGGRGERNFSRHHRHRHRIGTVRAPGGAGRRAGARAGERFVLPLRTHPRSRGRRLGQPPRRGADPRHRRRHARTRRRRGGHARLRTGHDRPAGNAGSGSARNRHPLGTAAGDPHRSRVRRRQAAGRRPFAVAGPDLAPRCLAGDRSRRGDRPHRGLRQGAGGSADHRPARRTLAARAGDPHGIGRARGRRDVRGPDTQRRQRRHGSDAEPLGRGPAARRVASARSWCRPPTAHAPAQPARGPRGQCRRRCPACRTVRGGPRLHRPRFRPQARLADPGAAAGVVGDGRRIHGRQGPRRGGACATRCRGHVSADRSRPLCPRPLGGNPPRATGPAGRTDRRGGRIFSNGAQGRGARHAGQRCGTAAGPARIRGRHREEAPAAERLPGRGAGREPRRRRRRGVGPRRGRRQRDSRRSAGAVPAGAGVEGCRSSRSRQEKSGHIAPVAERHRNALQRRRQPYGRGRR